MQNQNEETLTQGDLISVTALIDNLSDQKKLQRESACFLLETEFNVPHIRNIRRSDLDRAIDFLVDLQNITLH